MGVDVKRKREKGIRNDNWESVQIKRDGGVEVAK